ncbi:acyl-coenzyme A diphosphatase FITM2 [Brienomyrus brachyistius]|uniref:acyl-coenzyme A diphosphatase FITM2 n=1 Tax=Brienomyrus brachyistius TaxID=42636 RepID=UPI0020B1FEBA|nr:acyl-coenzyme A diphosphatase FITM2 [Brienomyrus brachyistius]
MEALEAVVKKLLTFWKITAVKQHLPYILLFISFTGSIIKCFLPMPETYFSNKRNFLNVYLVKFSWAWHLALLLPFIAFFNSISNTWGFVLQRLSSQLVSTAIWYICTQFFFYLEDVTGTCLENTAFTTKATCRNAGFQWDGYDISGHSFILGYSTLVIAEELVPMTDVKKAVGFHSHTSTALNGLYVALNALLAVWIWMFGCTSVYFHDILQKLLGTGFAIAGWYVTYRVWFPKPFSPGCPTQHKGKRLQA